ncbi:MAG: methyltransferase [Alphaproteobacteria bacterium]|nr:methyltransferase [Alphaproteobacteria bacterium]
MAEPAGASAGALLGGRVLLRQPAVGYRVAIDPVLLAAAVPAAKGDVALDVGAGVGAAALCLAARVEGVRVVGLEMQRELARLAADNVEENGLTDRIDMLIGDLKRPPPRLGPRSFDHVFANPPYQEAERATPTINRIKAIATIEGEAKLDDWMAFCLTMAKGGGTVTMIHRADRLPELLAALTERTGGIVVYPVWPRDPTAGAGDVPAKRVIVQARVGSKAPLRLLGGLCVHEADGKYTAAAEHVLRHGGPLALLG